MGERLTTPSAYREFVRALQDMEAIARENERLKCQVALKESLIDFLQPTTEQYIAWATEQAPKSLTPSPPKGTP